MIENIIFLLLYLLTEFVNYIFVYVVVFQMCLSKSKIRWCVCISMVILVHLLVMFRTKEPSSSISVITMILLPLLLVEYNWYKKMLLYPFVVLGSSVIIVCVSFILSVLMGVPEIAMVDSIKLSVLCQGILSVVLILYYIYRRIKKRQSIQVYLGWRQYVLFYTTVICIFFMLAPLQAMTRGSLSVEEINQCGVAISVACIIFVLLVLWQGIATHREVQLRERNRISEEYMEMQTDYFHRIVMQDEKIRRFKHDMDGHMKVLSAYCAERKNEELQNYLADMIKESAIYDVACYTKNRGVDAVIADMMEKAKNKNIQVEIKGVLPEKTKISVYDLCTIFSNLLKNAIEACEKIVDISDRSVVLVIESYDNMLYILIKNRVEQQVIINAGYLYTTKENSEEHGLGSGNVLNVVNKYNGDLEYKCENGWFSAEIAI